MKYLLDTDTCIHALEQRAAVLERMLSRSRADVAISVISEAELRTGAVKSSSPVKTLRLVENFLRPLTIVEFTSSDATSYANVRAKLERAGTPIGPFDTLIAAQALGRKLIVTNRKTGFKLSSAGWGEFRLRLAITLKNGKVLNRQHDLKLKYPRNPQRDGINPQRGDTAQVLGSAGTKTSAAPQLRVFLSSSVADAAIADAIKETLEQHGAKVVEADAVGPSFRPLVESMIRKADGIIGVLSPASGNSVHEELQLAERNGVPVWRIGVGSEPLVPEPHWRVDGPSDVASAVKRVEEMLASISNPPRQR